MANPFLFTEEPVHSTLGAGSTGFNPFLSGGFEEPPADNPFLSSFAAPQNAAVSSVGSNPFAFGAVDETPNMFDYANSNIDQSSVVNCENIFASQGATGMDIFATPLPSGEVYSENIFSSPLPNEEPLLLASPDPHSHESLETQQPRRPPPPRPGPPKETKDLILSVTGAMEATSSDLLDRLQANRTPSPTPMRDLNSPSPTQFGDLLDVDGPPAPPPTAIPQEANLLGDDFDFSAPVAMITSKETDFTGSIISPPCNEPSTTFNTIEALQSIPPVVPPVPSVPPLQQSAASNLSDVPPHSLPPVSAATTHSHPPRPVPPVPTHPPPGRPAPPSIPGRPKIPPQPTRPPVPAPPPKPAAPEPKIEPQPLQPFNDIFGSKTNSSELASNSIVAEPDGFSNVFPDSAVSQPHMELFSTDLSDDVFIAPGQEEGPFPDAMNQTHISDNTSALQFQPAQVPDVPNSKDGGTEAAPAPVPTESNEDVVLNFKVAAPPLPPARPAYNIFDDPTTQPSVMPAAVPNPPSAFPKNEPDEFDAFTAKFESVGVSEIAVDPFGSAPISVPTVTDPFDPFASSSLSALGPEGDASAGFGGDDNFDSFLTLREPPPVPQGTPARVSRAESTESNEGFDIFDRPKPAGTTEGATDSGSVSVFGAPSNDQSQMNAFQDSTPRFNPFDNTQEPAVIATENVFSQVSAAAEERQMARTDSQETPPTPLFDEDVSQPLEDFPRVKYGGIGWEMMLRQPNKKKITGQRFWKKIFVKLVNQGESPALQLFNTRDDKDPFQELPLQPCYSVSEIGAQQFDQFGKIFTVKLQFVFYKERPGVRPGQVTKAERITNKLSQFAAYAIQGDYQGVKEFGSDLKKLGLPVEHAPQISQLFKIGSQTFEDMKQFSMCIEEALFRLSAHRDRALNYKMEEVQITAVDELYVEQNATGGVEKQIARVRLFFLGFLSGMPDVELGVNDLVRQGKEVVGRHDIIPVVTEEWIRLEAVEFHSCIQLDEYERTRTIKFKPPDAMYIELMRFRVRPPRNRELPLQLKCTMCVTGNKVEIHGDILVPGFTSRKLGQIPCEDVMVRIPIPECWIYQFRVEKHFRYGSVKSAHRRTGKVKGIERFLGAIENMEPSLMEVTSGQAKYEHQHRAIVWRMSRLPKEGQGAYTTHNLVVRLTLTSYDQIPDELTKYAYVEFTMPATTVSHTTVRSVSIQDSDSDSPPEKYVRQLARCEYRVEIEHTQGDGPADYIAATAAVKPPAPIVEEPKPALPPESDSDSDSA